MAQIVFMLLIYNFLNNLSYAWRIYIGPLNLVMSHVAISAKQICGKFVMICITEIIVFKVVMIFAWKHYSIADEYFIYRVTIIFNYAFIFVNYSARLFLGASGSFGFEILSGTLLQDIFEKKYYLLMFFSINVITIMAGCTVILIMKQKNSMIFPNQNVNNVLNQNTHNEPMLNYLQIAWLTITFFMIASVYIQYFYAPKSYDGFTNHHSFLIIEIVGNDIYQSIFLDKLKYFVSF